jgi:hypothetical protein
MTGDCKTSIPGSNPGGASKFPVQVRRNVLQQRNPALAIGLRWTTNRRGPCGRIPASQCVRTVSAFASWKREEVRRTSALSRVVMVSHSPSGVADLHRVRAEDGSNPGTASPLILTREDQPFRSRSSNHSPRSATIGSSREARHAGMYAAHAHTTISTPAAVAYETESDGAIP